MGLQTAEHGWVTECGHAGNVNGCVSAMASKRSAKIFWWNFEEELYTMELTLPTTAFPSSATSSPGHRDKGWNTGTKLKL